MQQSGQTKTIYNTIFLKRFSLFHANGLDNPFGVRRKDLGDISYTSWVIKSWSLKNLTDIIG